MPVIWAPPQLDGDGNWLPEIQDGDTKLPTGTWYGFNFPKWRDAATRTLHEVRDAAHVDELLAREPRPAFLLLTGHGLDAFDLDVHAIQHGERNHVERVLAAVTHPVARVTTPTGGTHLIVPSSGKHNDSNTHSQCDYRGAGGLLALPGTRRSVNGVILEYVVEEFHPEHIGILNPTAEALYDEFSADKRRCNECAFAASKTTGASSGIPLGDGTGWDALEENPPGVNPDDPFGLPTARDLADALLTWEGMLAPWFNVIGRKDSDLYLIRAGKAVEGRQGKSAVIHCADNRFVAYSSDLPVATGTQLTKLDVYCAIKEAESPGEDAPEDFAERMKWMRDRWAGLLYSEHDLEVPRHLRMNCADETVARTPEYPILSDDFWEAHPVLKRIRSESFERSVSPEAVLTGVLLRTLLHIGPQVVLPPRGNSNDPEEGCTLNAGAIIVGEYGDGKGAAEAVADRYVPTRDLRVKSASGQAFARMFGYVETPKKSKDDAFAHTDADTRPRFVRTHWARYTLYDEMDEFEAQMNMQNSTLSPVLRSILTSDVLEERVAIGKDSQQPRVDGFRVVFVAHAQPTRIDWLLTHQASGGFPQRLWYSYAAADQQDFPEEEIPAIEPLDLALPDGWRMPDDIKSTPRRVVVPLTMDMRREVWDWAKSAPEDDKRGMLCVRLKAYAAMLVLMPDLLPEDRWKLATDFHSLCYRTRHYAQTLIKRERQRQVARTTQAKVAEQSALSKARAADEIAETKREIRRRVLAILDDGNPQAKRKLLSVFSSNRRTYLDEVLVTMETDQEIRNEDGRYRLW